MKKLLIGLASALLLFLAWGVQHQLTYPIRYEWADTAAPGSQAKALQGSLTRQTLYPRGLSLDIKFRDGARFTWTGDAAMAPVGLVERAEGTYLVLQTWGRPQGEVAAGKPPRQLVCQLRETASGPAGPGSVVTPLFVPTDVPNNLWPWATHVQVSAAVLSRGVRAEPERLLAQTTAALGSSVGACPDLRRADHL